MASTWVSGHVWVLGIIVLACTPTSSGDDDDDSDGGPTLADCTSYCSALTAADCKDYDHDACVAGCTSFDDFSKDTNRCDVEYGAMLDCFDAAPDICQILEVNPDTGKLAVCSAETEDFAKCYADYCQDHSAESYCN